MKRIIRDEVIKLFDKIPLATNLARKKFISSFLLGVIETLLHEYIYTTENQVFTKMLLFCNKLIFSTLLNLCNKAILDHQILPELS